MAKGQETELKLAASPAMLLHLRENSLLAGKDRALTLVTRYFDTRDGALHRAGATLRLRDGGAHSEQTFKTASKKGAVRRGEWNAPTTGSVPDPAAFPAQVKTLLDEILSGAALQPLAVTRIERTTRHLHFGTSTIEAAFDFGTVEATRASGVHSEPVCELELELLKGEAADLFALARQLPLGPELGWSTQSKGERGHALALALPFAATRASGVALTKRMDVGKGFQAIAWNCLEQLLGNCRQVIADGDADAVHQSRVAMRRLRAAFSLFGPNIAGAETPIFRAEWKAAASALGPARDFQVLVERVEQAATESTLDTSELLARLRGKRAAATRAAQTALAGQAFQHLLVRFAEWLERQGWRGPGADAPLADFAAHELGRRRRKIAKAGPLGEMSDEALHELRIKGKKLRYAAEFFAKLYPEAERTLARKAFAKALGKVQDDLGSANDLAVAQAQRDELFADLEPITAAGLSAQLAELLESHGASRKQLIKSAAKALGEVAHAPAWWTPEEPIPPPSPPAAD